MNYDIKISGTGSLDQIATRLIELGRQMQVAGVYGGEHKLPQEISESNDGLLEVEFKSDPMYDVYIDFLNKDKGFREDRKNFTTYEGAVEWGKVNIENFHIDMVKCL